MTVGGAELRRRERCCERLLRINPVERQSRPRRSACGWQVLSYFAGNTIGAPFSLIRNTRNFAGLVLLAFRLTT